MGGRVRRTCWMPGNSCSKSFIPPLSSTCGCWNCGTPFLGSEISSHASCRGRPSSSMLIEAPEVPGLPSQPSSVKPSNPETPRSCSCRAAGVSRSSSRTWSKVSERIRAVAMPHMPPPMTTAVNWGCCETASWEGAAVVAGCLKGPTDAARTRWRRACCCRGG